MVRKSRGKPKVMVVQSGEGLGDVFRAVKKANDWLRKTKVISRAGGIVGTGLSYVPHPGVSAAGSAVKSAANIAGQAGYGRKRRAGRPRKH